MGMLRLSVLTTVKVENYGISANVVDDGMVDGRVSCAFKKGHGGRFNGPRPCDGQVVGLGMWLYHRLVTLVTHPPALPPSVTSALSLRHRYHRTFSLHLIQNHFPCG